MTGSIQKQLYIILVAAALFRFGFLFFGDVLPVMWDARRYVGASIGLISYIDDSGIKAASSAQQDRRNFKFYTDKYIQGEQIEWLKYQPFTLTEARNEIFIGGPLYPTLMGIILYLSPTADFTVIRFVNILLDILATLLVVLVAMRFIPKEGAIISGYIYAFYFPFTLLTSMLLLESSTSLLMLLAVYLFLRGFETDHKKYYILTGVVTGLLILHKPTAMFLALPFVLSFFWFALQKYKPNFILNRLFYFVVPFLMIAVSWTVVASVKYGQFTFRDPSYKEANLRQSSNILYEGYDLDKVEKGFWEYSISEHILNDPIGYTGLLAKKFTRLWGKPANEFNKNYILPSTGWEIVHLLLVAAGLFGLILLLIQNSRVGVWILFIAGYYTGIHLIFHSVSRYSFNALPFLFMAAAYFMVSVKNLSAGRNARVKAICCLVSLLFLYSWNEKIVTQLLGIELTGLIVIVSNIAVLLASAVLLFLLSRFMLENRKMITQAVLPVISILIFSLFIYTNVFSRTQWTEFSCTLSDISMKAGTRLFISKQQTVKPGELLAAVVDVNSGEGRKNSFILSIGQNEFEFVGGEPPLSDLFYPKPTYQYYSQFQPIAIEAFRQYAIVPIEPELIRREVQQNGFIDISVAINERFQEENNFITVFGNLRQNENSAYMPGIRFTSIERYVDKGDPRIRIPVKYYSDSTISYYIKRDQQIPKASSDLSPSGGIQNGRYNIFLVHFFPNGDFRVY